METTYGALVAGDMFVDMHGDMFIVESVETFGADDEIVLTVSNPQGERGHEYPYATTRVTLITDDEWAAQLV